MKAFIAAAAMLLPAAPADPAALFASGDFSAAATAAQATLAQHPADPKALVVAATIALYRNDLETASADLGRIPSNAADAPRIARLVAEIHHRERLVHHDDMTFGPERDVTAFAERSPLPVVPVTINGHRAFFQIDTGAPGIALDRDFAKSLGLPPAPAHRAMFADGKPVEIPGAHVAAFGLGGATVHDLSADLLPLHELMHGATPVDGAVGMSVLGRFAGFTLDYANKRLVTYSPAAKIDVEAETTVPLYLVGDHFLATRSSIADVDGMSLIDTGLIGAGIVVSKEVVDRAHLALTDAGSGFAPTGAKTHGSSVTVPELRIGATVAHDVPGIYSPAASPVSILPFSVNGTISQGCFEHRAITFDFTHMQLSISAAS